MNPKLTSNMRAGLRFADQATGLTIGAEIARHIDHGTPLSDQARRVCPELLRPLLDAAPADPVADSIREGLQRMLRDAGLGECEIEVLQVPDEFIDRQPGFEGGRPSGEMDTDDLIEMVLKGSSLTEGLDVFCDCPDCIAASAVEGRDPNDPNDPDLVELERDLLRQALVGSTIVSLHTLSAIVDDEGLEEMLDCMAHRLEAYRTKVLQDD